MIKIFSNLNSLNNFAAEKFIEIGKNAIEKRGKFTVALAGGSTPKSLYNLLASENFRSQIDWQKVFFFFGDERYVLPEAEESNFRMANESFLKPLQILPENIFRWRTEIKGADQAAKDYERIIIEFFDLKSSPPAHAGGSDRLPRFNLILLGMGDDGHTASLFPFTEALNERQKIAVANPVEKLNSTRLTLAFPVINNARNVIFLVKGADKAETLREVLQGESKPEKLPAQTVKPIEGDLLWLIDQQAALLLK
jgi:6-phosphogluconolactonase